MVFFLAPLVPYVPYLVGALLVTAGVVAADQSEDVDLNINEHVADLTAFVVTNVVTTISGDNPQNNDSSPKVIEPTIDPSEAADWYNGGDLPSGNSEGDEVPVFDIDGYVPGAVNGTDSVNGTAYQYSPAFGFINVHSTSVAEPDPDIDWDEGAPPSCSFDVYVRSFDSGAAIVFMLLLIFAGAFWFGRIRNIMGGSA